MQKRPLASPRRFLLSMPYRRDIVELVVASHLNSIAPKAFTTAVSPRPSLRMVTKAQALSLFWSWTS